MGLAAVFRGSPASRRIALAALLLLLLVGGAWLAWDACNTTVGEVGGEIDRELPPGSSTSEIVAYLNDHHTEYIDRGLADDFVAEEFDVPAGTPYLFGRFNNTRVGPLGCDVDLALVFALDSSGRLDYYRLKEWYTCL